MTPVIENANPARFWSHVERTENCWAWNGRIRPDGYGKYLGTGAHRVAYTLAKGAIPPGLEIDHLCRNIRCVNPQHLEAVTRRENMRRRASLYTHCKHGHEFTTENTYVRTDGTRDCRACIRRRAGAYQARQRRAS